jgi:probable F420-dependent oxidoreductase
MLLRPFRFGTGVFGAASAAEYGDAAKRVEDLGYSTFLLPDHFDSQDGLAPVPALVSAAHATKALRVGSLVFDNDFRHPTMLAKEAATIDLLTDGRLDFGIGAGWNKEEYDQIGLAFESAAVRVARLTEAVTLIKQLWTGEPVTFRGEHYQVTNLINYPVPHQDPHPPIFVGGGGRQLLTMAAREANIVGVVAKALPAGGLNVAEDSEVVLDRKIRWVREAAGDRFDQIELNMLVWKVVVTDKPQTTAAEVATTFGLTTEQVLASPYFLIGSVDGIAQRLVSLRAKYGISYIAVFPEDMNVFAPVVSRLVGT